LKNVGIATRCDTSHFFNQEALKDLWRASFPGAELRGLISEQWKEMGWQGKDPSTDFRYWLFSFIPPFCQYFVAKIDKKKCIVITEVEASSPWRT
jgi:hypothetical protein